MICGVAPLAGVTPAEVRADVGAFSRVLAHPVAFQTVFARRDDALGAAVSPFLTFAFIVHRGWDELHHVGHVDEWVGPRRRLPVFSGGDLFDFLESPANRLFVTELLASYTRVASGAVWEHTRREGVDDPGAFPVAVDLVEALVAIGEEEEASAVTARLAELSRAQEHPWGLPSTMRCQALIEIAAGRDVEDASARLLEAASSYEQLGLRFDHARTLLTLGRSRRRTRRWAAARAALEEAAVVFEDCGAEGWGGEARAELDRIGGRRPAAGGLTPSERSVVDLAVNGLANKEIAAALFVSVRTVETHLSHAYAKLGVRSRSQLARRLAAPG